MRDIVGLYLAPPDRALVLCVDEKSQVQALDRTQPLLPLRPGQVERRTHDYARHGTMSLFAALDVKAGTVIGRCFPRHRAIEFRKFLDEIDAAVPPDLDVHLVLDNSATHKTKLIRDWLAKRPRYHVHFTPTSASWINQVERWFGLLTDRALRRGVHRSLADLERDIRAFIDATNAEPEAIPLGEVGRRHPRQRQALLPPDHANPEVCAKLQNQDSSHVPFPAVRRPIPGRLRQLPAVLCAPPAPAAPQTPPTTPRHHPPSPWLLLRGDRPYTRNPTVVLSGQAARSIV